ncbi:MAG: 2-oxoglutarate dehydrogenase complex dihydrolipoyllysine-residue succinyltransferase [Gammaproteobacteria bacterium]|nr:2-oxoglutarate dehydrogenase complex dihydrolipoyllysine-residue succinyltransferase [Gammaproteobacteria bacterium]
MSIEVKVPSLPESVADATLVTWHKAAGDTVERDENLADLETDKVVLELPAPARGVLRELRVPAGTTVTSGQLLAILEPAAEGSSARPVPAATAVVPPVAVVLAVAAPVAAPVAAMAGRSAGKTGPAVRRVLQAQGIDPAMVQGSGPEGRIVKADVVKQDPSGPNLRPVPAAQPPIPAVGTPGGRTERRVAMSRLRTRIAQRMVEAQQNAAMLTTFNEVDLSAVMALRARYKDTFEKQHGVKLGFMGFFVKAAIEALQRYPVVNASVEANDIVYHDYFDVGIAVSTDRGLIVPVLRDADRFSFPGIESAIADFGRRAREGSLSMEDLMGGTFTITNGGVFGSLLSTPILNPPQSGILGMHKIQERPVVVDGQVVARPMMYVALTYDHRIIDGREAVQFLVAMKNTLEDPARLLLGV